MTAKHITLRPGRAAIAAVLALTPASLFAQDAATDTTGPVVVPAQSLPSTTNAPTVAPAPTIVLPDITPATTATTGTTTAAPATTSAPAPATATRRTATTARRATATPARTTTAAPRTTTASAVAAEEVPANEAALPVEQAPVAAPVVAGPVAPMAAADTPVESQREDVTEALAQILAGLLVAGIAIGGLVMLMRRRRVADEAVPVIERPIVREPAPLPERAVQPQHFAPAPSPAYAPAPSTGAVLPAAAGAAVALPREAPEDPVARGELLKRMVDAEPDRANPFRSPKARLRRARLILQSLGRRFENSAPRFDLSDYTSNWPALARRDRLATA